MKSLYLNYIQPNQPFKEDRHDLIQEPKKRMTIKPQYKIAAIYFAIGVLWIFFSDFAVGILFERIEDITVAQHIKGWFFIFVTGMLLFFLIQKDVNKITRTSAQLAESYEQTIHGWVRVMDLRHQETTDHTARVTRMTLELARIAGITGKQELKRIERAALLHDIGKIGIPDASLIKPGKLVDEEWDLIKMHPQIAHDILSNISFLKPSIDIPYAHHEKWDGSGYPQGLKGDAIPMAARLFAIVDVWDALIHPRVYKDAWPEEKVLKYIKEQAGKHFDPHIVKLYLENYPRIKKSLSAA